MNIFGWRQGRNKQDVLKNLKRQERKNNILQKLILSPFKLTDGYEFCVKFGYLPETALKRMKKLVVNIDKIDNSKLNDNQKENFVFIESNIIKRIGEIEEKYQKGGKK